MESLSHRLNYVDQRERGAGFTVLHLSCFSTQFLSLSTQNRSNLSNVRVSSMKLNEMVLIMRSMAGFRRQGAYILDTVKPSLA